MALRVLAVVLLAVVSAAEAAKATPIEKVTELLKGLQTKVAEEGKKEAAAYDKYACFCKEQADKKIYSTEKSTDKINKLTAQIKSLDANIAGLNSDIGKMSRKITGLNKEIDDDAGIRAKDHDNYLARAKDLSEAIDACATAIEAIKDSKGDLKNAKVNLMQMQKKAPSESLALMLKEFTAAEQAPAKYTFQGNGIIATLEQLLADFKQNKASMDTDEFDINSVFEKKALGDANERKFAQQEKDEKSALAEEATESRSDAQEASDEEKGDRAADQEFLDTLTGNCEDKAKLFDQRSQTRAGELTAMTEAIAHLADGAKEEGANKNLVGLVQKKLSFVQLSSIRTIRTIRTLNQDSNQAVKRVQALLQEAASNLDSSVLKGAAARVQLSADHFVKVRQLIKDLIGKLRNDANEEADQKSFCDRAMRKAVVDRDDGKSKQEAAHAKVTMLTAQKEDLENDISDLNAGIAANKKAYNEATELRNEEKNENEETVVSATAGKIATENAMKVLNGFYQNALLQTSKKYVPPNSDRDGNTVGDLAPETFDEDYHGSQSESKGIVGMLEVIVSDFDRTVTTTKANEKAAAGAYDKFEKESNADTKTKGETIDKKDAKVKQTGEDILKQEQNHMDATDLFDSGVEKLDDLKAMCVEGEETWEERAAARKKEVEALKDAQRILDEWQN